MQENCGFVRRKPSRLGRFSQSYITRDAGLVLDHATPYRLITLYHLALPFQSPSNRASSAQVGWLTIYACLYAPAPHPTQSRTLIPQSLLPSEAHSWKRDAPLSAQEENSDTALSAWYCDLIVPTSRSMPRFSCSVCILPCTVGLPRKPPTFSAASYIRQRTSFHT